jgi:hypothetical protein
MEERQAYDYAAYNMAAWDLQSPNFGGITVSFGVLLLL